MSEGRKLLLVNVAMVASIAVVVVIVRALG